MEHLVGLVVGPPECLLVASLENFVGLDKSGPLDVHRSTEFANAAITPGVVLDQFCFLGELECLDDVVEIMLFPISHIVSEHLDDLRQIKLPSPAELKKEVILVPGVLGHVIFSDPCLELVQDLLLVVAHVSDVPKEMMKISKYLPFVLRCFCGFLPAPHYFLNLIYNLIFQN